MQLQISLMTLHGHICIQIVLSCIHTVSSDMKGKPQDGLRLSKMEKPTNLSQHSLGAGNKMNRNEDIQMYIPENVAGRTISAHEGTNQVYHNRIKRAALRDRMKLWPNATVPCMISRKHSSNERLKIIAAIKDFHRKTCVRFIPRTRAHRNYIYIWPDDGCYSEGVGWKGGWSKKGRQIVSLGKGCFQHGTIIHELMHVLGFFHEHNRSDRDKYVKIIWKNLSNESKLDFHKWSMKTADDLGTPYDYGSVMHGGLYDSSRNDYPTIVPLKPGVTIGQRNGFSYYDLKRINLSYGCDTMFHRISPAGARRKL